MTKLDDLQFQATTGVAPAWADWIDWQDQQLGLTAQ